MTQEEKEAAAWEWVKINHPSLLAIVEILNDTKQYLVSVTVKENIVAMYLHLTSNDNIKIHN